MKRVLFLSGLLALTLGGLAAPPAAADRDHHGRRDRDDRRECDDRRDRRDRSSRSYCSRHDGYDECGSRRGRDRDDDDRCDSRDRRDRYSNSRDGGYVRPWSGGRYGPSSGSRGHYDDHSGERGSRGYSRGRGQYGRR